MNSMSDIDQLLATPAAVASVRAYEQARHELSFLSDADKPDKHTTVFINSADLVWAWLAEPGTGGALDFIAGSATREDLAGFVSRHEFIDPDLVALVEADGGLRYQRR